MGNPKKTAGYHERTAPCSIPNAGIVLFLTFVLNYCEVNRQLQSNALFKKPFFKKTLQGSVVGGYGYFFVAVQNCVAVAVMFVVAKMHVAVVKTINNM